MFANFGIDKKSDGTKGQNTLADKVRGFKSLASWL